MKWKRFNGVPIQQPIQEVVEQTILRERANGHHIKLYIGTDSQVYGSNTEFATVIVFLRERSGGFMFVQHDAQKRNYGIRERMLLEVSKSIGIAYDLCEILTKYDVPMEVHADINTDPQFKSNAALSEAMGYIMGMGFAFKAKPHAFASTTCADRVIH